MSRKVQFIKHNQPKFIQEFKERAGLKPPTSIEDKIQTGSVELDDRSDNEEEKPVIVLPEDNSITEEDVKRAEDGGKIKFRKPTANKRPAAQGLSASSKKQSKSHDQTKRHKSTTKKVASSSLLSFDDNDDEA